MAEDDPILAQGEHYSADRGSAGLLRIGVGGPVGSGKTALVLRLCQRFWPEISLGVVTNDIFTRAVSYTHLTLPTNREV